MHFVTIFGPPAVGKMSVGHELRKLTGLALFHNHMTVDLAVNFFPWGHRRFEPLVHDLRLTVFRHVAASELPGIIFTYVWALDREEDRRFMDDCRRIFEEAGGRTAFVELYASENDRIRRDRGEFRLSMKPLKRDKEDSARNLLAMDRAHRLNTDGDFDYSPDYLRIDNTDVSAAEAAKRIVERFSLPHIAD
jgi:hypothetical protein